MVTPSEFFASMSWANAFELTILMSMVSKIVIKDCLFIFVFLLFVFVYKLVEEHATDVSMTLGYFLRFTIFTMSAALILLSVFTSAFLKMKLSVLPSMM